MRLSVLLMKGKESAGDRECVKICSQLNRILPNCKIIKGLRGRSRDDVDVA